MSPRERGASFWSLRSSSDFPAEVLQPWGSLCLGLLLRLDPQELPWAEVWGKESASAHHRFHFLPQSQRALI